MLILYYFPTSHWSRIISLALAESGLEHQRRLVDIRAGASFEPDYLRINPRGVVPTLVDGDTVVWDGRRIARHIDERAKSELWRAGDSEAQAWIERPHDFPIMLFSYAVWVLGQRGEKSATILDDKVERARRLADAHPELAELYLRKAAFFDAFRVRVYDDEHLARERARWRGVLDEMGRALAERPWLAGADYSFADCIATSILYRLVDLGDRGGLDHWYHDAAHGLTAYFARLRGRPSYTAVFIDDPLISPTDRESARSV